MTRLINLAGMAFYEIKSISVNEWHPLPDGQGKPEQVHLEIELEGSPHPLVMRFRSPRAVVAETSWDALWAAVMTLRAKLNGPPGGGRYA